ncbi:MAG: hypothetical protein JXR48_11775 [Candidatus Delongbacteria bacterium]|nr:hypothetical protein [Candidatus Delongbacteria bacterium]MBN2835630.1 hypothetical protein [Candidatus Delongbacteria bacterium]
MAKKQVYGLKAGRGLCPVCGETVQHIKFVKPFIPEGNSTFKYEEFVAKVCKCPGKTMKDFTK